MLVTGIIVLGVAVYAVWAVRKIRKDRKNGACCGGSCSGCVGKEPAAEEPKEEPEEKGGLNPALILLPLLLIGGGGAFYYFKFVKDKSSTKGNDDLGEYDFEDEYEDTEVEYLDDTPKEDESV